MIEIRPVSDLRNNFPQIESLVLEGKKPVYLTKNGHGTMVVMSIEEYSCLQEKAERLEQMEKELAEKQSAANQMPPSRQQIYSASPAQTEETYRKIVNRISGK